MKKIGQCKGIKARVQLPLLIIFHNLQIGVQALTRTS